LSTDTVTTEVKKTMAPRRRGDKTAEPTEPARKSTRSRRGGGGGEAKNEMPAKKSPAKKGTVAKAAPPQRGTGDLLRRTRRRTPKGKAKGKQQAEKPVAKPRRKRNKTSKSLTLRWTIT
jgi:hypothetical protein